jgi:tetratricopeptide (TPR) repeat protein
MSRTYHNITSQYNIYFNGNESYKKGIKRLNTSYKDDYTSLLPVFPFPNTETTNGSNAEMDRAIKKSLKVIKLHSITAKPEFKNGVKTKRQKELYNKKEYNKWVDDAYLLMGKSSLMKGDVMTANASFRQILKEYPKANTELETQIYLVRNLIIKEEYLEALEILTKLETDEKMPRKLSALYHAAFADYYIQKKKFSDAISQLEIAEEKARDKKSRLRYIFILGQLYERTGKMSKASEKYNKIIKMSPPYEMTFNARINLAGAYESGISNPDEIRKELYKLLKDEKNKEFLDQIYYALANIDFKENKIDDAIKNYKLSAWKSVSNQRQKARSYLAIADIYYSNKDYLAAQSLYDSAVVNLDPTFPDFSRIEARSKSLKRLADNLNMVSLQDSVLFIAKMSENERNLFIDNIIARVKEKEAEEQAKQQEELLAQQSNNQLLNDLNPNSNDGTNAATDAGGKWYFYNPSSKSYGETEFQLKWGKRKLEDNWRRLNKKMALTSGDSETENEDANSKDNEKKKGLSNKTREFYMVNIPLNDSMIQASHKKIRKSLYGAGTIYKDELSEYKLAAREYNDIIKRYPSDPIVPETAYQLYILNRQLGNMPKADEYKNLLFTQFPESTYAKLLANPNFANELQEKENAVGRLYEAAYIDFNNSNYSLAYEKANQGLINYPNHKLVPKFTFIKALATGKMANVDTLRRELTRFIKIYPKSEEATVANNIISLMDVKHPEVKEKEEKVVAQEIYKLVDENEKHFFAVVLNPKQGGNYNQLVFNLINYNLDNYSQANLNTKSEGIGNNQMVVVREFKTKNEALNYFNIASKDESIKKDAGSILATFIISETNFSILKQDGSESKYMQFFISTYTPQ